MCRWKTFKVGVSCGHIVYRGVAMGECISVYIPPKSVYLTNFYVVTGCFSSLTQDKFDIVPVCALAGVSFTYHNLNPPKMKFLATPLIVYR